MVAQSTDEWTATELFERLMARESFMLLDVRAGDEFEEWRIEGREPLATRSAPYFELIERAESDDPKQCATALIAMPDAVPLPKDVPILVACAKGGSSAFIADGLRQLGYRAVNLAGGMEAWSHTTFAMPVVRGARRTGDMAVGASEASSTIFQVGRPSRGCLSYVIVSAGEAAIIDPLRDPEPYLALLDRESLRAAFVLDTHAHADHVSGGPALAKRLDVPYWLHPYDAIHPMDLVPGSVAYEPLRDDQTLKLGQATIEVLHIPGHTLGNVALRIGGSLLSGDSIFIDSVARPDLGGRGEAWARLHWRSLRRLLTLADDVTVLPGHVSTLAEADSEERFAARLGDLRRSNEGLREAQKSEDEFVAWIMSHAAEIPLRYIDIKRVNLGLKQVDDDGAAELEIGKNVCAMANAR